MVTISVMCVFIPSDVTFKQTKLRLYQATMLQEKKKESSKVVEMGVLICGSVNKGTDCSQLFILPST